MNRLLLVCLSSAVLAAAGPAQEASWVGRRVIPKQPGLKIGYSDDKGNPVPVAELTALAYTVLAEQEDFVKVEHRGRAGWLPRAEMLLPDAAVAYFTERARIDSPKESTALAFLGWAYFEKKDLPQALKVYDEVLRRKPTADWHNNRGAILLEMRQPERALADFAAALRLNPEFDVAVENRARAHAQLGKTEQAVADWTEALRRNPANAEAHLQRGLLHRSRENNEAARADLDRAVELLPAVAGPRIERGKLHFDQDRFDAALADFTEAIRLAGSNAEQRAAAHALRAGVHTQQKAYEQALDDLAETIRLAPEDMAAVEARGWNRFLLGRFEEAGKDFETAIQHKPNDPSPYNCQAWLWATCPKDELRNGKKALEYAQKAVSLTQEKDPGYLDTLAAALAELGRFDEAVQVQERVVQAAAQDAELLPEAQARLALYRKMQPYRQPVGK